MENQVTLIIGGLILTGILWLLRTTNETSKTVAILRTILIGESGENGLNSEVKQLRKRTHEHGDAIHAMQGKHDLHALRIQQLEDNAT